MLHQVLFPIIWPILGALTVLFIPKRAQALRNIVSVTFAFITLVSALMIFGKELQVSLPLIGFGIDASFRSYNFSSFIITAASMFTLLIALYSTSYLQGKDNAKAFFFFMLFTLAFVNGAVLSDNLVLMMFFWEGLLCSLFGMIYIGGKSAYKTAIKAFTINGVTDVTMMVGIALTAYLANTLTISQIHLSLDGIGSIAFTLLMIGAIAKAGAMPFHSWIPDAANEAPLPFMAFLPSAIEKLLGIYFLTRISIDMFTLTGNSWVSMLLMVIGCATLLLAAMMAFVQKEMNKMLAYSTISQVGYILLGIGSAVPAGIVGGLFHTINHAMYKSTLFMTSGSVEKQNGTTELSKLGGIGRAMPFTFIAFLITAAAIAGVPPLNGFFSKELIYDAALERGWIFYFIAALGSFFTAATILKIAHAVYFGKKTSTAKEVSWPMYFPMLFVALLCIGFGIFNSYPLNYLIQPILGASLEGHSYAGWPSNVMVVIFSLLILALVAYVHNKNTKGKTASSASDWIRNAPVMSGLYDAAEKKITDPYNIAINLVGLFAGLAMLIDRVIDWIYQVLAVSVTAFISQRIKALHTGNYAHYVVWSILGASFVFYMMFFAR
jgi:formate hydrogenlyase subunit 3/multisubunit Na+/H+ antiporter MnhD subunit